MPESWLEYMIRPSIHRTKTSQGCVTSRGRIQKLQGYQGKWPATSRKYLGYLGISRNIGNSSQKAIPRGHVFTRLYKNFNRPSKHGTATTSFNSPDFSLGFSSRFRQAGAPHNIDQSHVKLMNIMKVSCELLGLKIKESPNFPKGTPNFVTQGRNIGIRRLCTHFLHKVNC